MTSYSLWYNSISSCNGSTFKAISVPFGQCFGGSQFTCAGNFMCTFDYLVYVKLIYYVEEVLSVLAYPTANCSGTPVPSIMSLPYCLGPDETFNSGQYEYVACNSQAVSLPSVPPVPSYTSAGWINYFFFDSPTCDNSTYYYLQSKQLGICFQSNLNSTVFEMLYMQASVTPGFVDIIIYSYADSLCTQLTNVRRDALTLGQCESKSSLSSIKHTYSAYPEQLSPSVSL